MQIQPAEEGEFSTGADTPVMLADGGDCVTDTDAYRGQDRLFGARASETTTHRVLKSVDELAGPRSSAA